MKKNRPPTWLNSKVTFYTVKMSPISSLEIPFSQLIINTTKRWGVNRSCDKNSKFSNVASVCYFSNVYFSWNLSRNVWEQQAIHQTTLTAQQHKHTKRPLIMSHNKVEKKKKNLWKFVAFLPRGEFNEAFMCALWLWQGVINSQPGTFGWGPCLSVAHEFNVFLCVCLKIIYVTNIANN